MDAKVMTLVFDAFPSMDKAEAFVAAVKKRFGLDGRIYTTQDDADRADLLEVELDPPIVHIDRSDSSWRQWDQRLEHEVIELVVEPEFDGHFCGM